MTSHVYTRLRQICVATLDLKGDTQKLESILGAPVCHSSQLDEFGLENTMFAVGGSFIELVAPTRKNTAVHRFIAANEGRGGYMAIFDCENTTRFRMTASKNNIRVIVDQQRPGADLLQLNPKDTGVTMLEFDHHKKSKDRLGAYEWAGEDWQQNLVADIEVQSIEMACQNPAKKHQDWSKLFDISENNNVSNIQLDYGAIDFSELKTGTRDYFKSVTLSSKNSPKYLQRAKANGFSLSDDSFEFCGIIWKLHAT